VSFDSEQDNTNKLVASTIVSSFLEPSLPHESHDSISAGLSPKLHLEHSHEDEGDKASNILLTLSFPFNNVVFEGNEERRPPVGSFIEDSGETECGSCSSSSMNLKSSKSSSDV
jgi:hypothetical protein